LASCPQRKTPKSFPSFTSRLTSYAQTLTPSSGGPCPLRARPLSYWRSIQLATRSDKMSRSRTRSFQTQIFNHQSAFRPVFQSNPGPAAACSRALLFLSRRATQDNKIRVFVNSSRE